MEFRRDMDPTVCFGEIVVTMIEDSPFHVAPVLIKGGQIQTFEPRASEGLGVRNRLE